MKISQLYSQLESLLDSLSKETKLLVEFGREEKKGIKNTLTNEYISLRNYFENNPVPSVYQEKELTILQTTIENRKKDLKKLREGYQKVETLEKEIESQFNIAIKETLAYKQLQQLLDTMRMYLNFDRPKEFREILQEFLKLREELKSLPSQKARYLEEQLEIVKRKVGRVQSANKAKEFNKYIDKLLALESKKLTSKSREILNIREEIDKTISREFINNIRENLIISVRKRLLNNLDVPKIEIEDYNQRLNGIRNHFLTGWKDRQFKPEE